MEAQNSEIKLTPESPIPQEVLGKLNSLKGARQHLSDRLLDLEQDKIQIMAAARRLDEEQQAIFHGILTERGLPQNAVVEIDAATGKLTVQEIKPT
jgi:hypothetical protein